MIVYACVIRYLGCLYTIGLAHRRVSICTAERSTGFQVGRMAFGFQSQVAD